MLVAVYVLYAVGWVPVTPAFGLMAALALASLFLGTVFHDAETEDRRADLPLAMAGTWAVLYLWKTGLFIEVLAVLSWPASIVGIGVVLMRGYSWKWIPVGFLVLVLFNLVVFFAFWRG